MQTKVLGVNKGGSEVSLRATEGGVIYTAPIALLWTTKGYSFSAMSTSSGAALVVRPSTVALSTLRNTSSDKVLVIERAFAHMLVGDAQVDYSMWICAHPPLSTVDTDDITARNNSNGRAAGGSQTTFDVGATVADDGWFPWGEGYTTVTDTTPGGILTAEIGGRLMVPSQASISLTVVATAATGLFTCGFQWFEVPVSELLVS